MATSNNKLDPNFGMKDLDHKVDNNSKLSTAPLIAADLCVVDKS